MGTETSFDLGVVNGETPVQPDGVTVPLVLTDLDLLCQDALEARLSRHCLVSSPSSISAIFSQLPC